MHTYFVSCSCSHCALHYGLEYTSVFLSASAPLSHTHSLFHASTCFWKAFLPSTMRLMYFFVDVFGWFFRSGDKLSSHIPYRFVNNVTAIFNEGSTTTLCTLSWSPTELCWACILEQVRAQYTSVTPTLGSQKCLNTVLLVPHPINSPQFTSFQDFPLDHT